MSYILAFLIVIILIALTLILNIFIPKPKCYFTPKETYEELIILEDYDDFEDIQKEIKNYVRDNKENIIKIDMNNFIHLKKVLSNFSFIENVYIQKIDPKTDSKQYKDSESKNKLRCIYTISIPGAKRSYIWCDGEKKFFYPGEIIIFDPSRDHSFHNTHKNKESIILCMDISR